MILKNNTTNIIDGDSFGDVLVSEIDSSKLSKLFGVLSGLYKNSIGSIVREYTSNMIDAMVAAGKSDEPVIVELNYKYGDSSIRFKDTGIGMSPEIMNKVFKNYLSSTKEETNEFIGSFGIGSKVGLTYTHTIFIHTISDGIKYEYIYYKQANGIPALELVMKYNVSECNGTTIIIPVKDEDVYKFSQEINNQIVYFPNVYVDNKYSSSFNNAYTIYEFDDFLYRKDYPNSHMHLTMGGVKYNIDWSELGIEAIDIPIALKFDIGEINPIPSREDILYSKESIKAIKDKIYKVFDYFIDKYETTSIEIENIVEYKKYFNKKTILIKIDEVNDIGFQIKKSFFSKYPEYKRKINFEVKLKLANQYLNSDVLYELRYFGYEVYNKTVSCSTGNILNYSSTNDFRYYNYNDDRIINNWYEMKYEYPRNPIFYQYGIDYILRGNESPNDRNKNITLTDEYKCNNYVFIKEKPISLDLWKKLVFSPLSIPKSEWRDSIKLILYYSKQFVETKYEYYSDIIVDEDYVKQYKESIRKREEETILAEQIRKESIKFEVLINNGYNDSKWDTRYELENSLRRLSHTIVWFDYKDRENAKSLFNIVKNYFNKKVVSIISIAPSHIKNHFSNDKHIIKYEDFIDGSSKLNRQLSTLYYIKKELNLPSVKFKIYRNDISNIIFPKYKDEMSDIYKKLDNFNNVDYWGSNKMLSTIYNNSIKLNNIDWQFVETCKQLSIIGNKFNLITNKNGYYDYSISQIVNFFRLNNLDINRGYYLKPEYNYMYNNNKLLKRTVWNNR